MNKQAVRSVGLPEVEVRGNEGPVYLDCRNVVASVLMTLAAHVDQDPQGVIDTLRDINAVAAVEARDIYVEGATADDRLDELLRRLGWPVIEINPGLAISYASRLEDAADSVSTAADLDVRHQFKLRAAQKMVTHEAEQNMIRMNNEAEQNSIKHVGAAMVARLGESRPAFGTAAAIDNTADTVQPHEQTLNTALPKFEEGS